LPFAGEEDGLKRRLPPGLRTREEFAKDREALGNVAHSKQILTAFSWV